MSVKFSKVSEMPSTSIKECEKRVAQCWDEIHDAEAQLTFHMSKGGKPDYDKEMIEHYMNLVETRKTYLRQALEMLVYVLKQKLDDQKAVKPNVVKSKEQKPEAKITKKIPLKKPRFL
jgi:hypothetical protein